MKTNFDQLLPNIGARVQAAKFPHIRGTVVAITCNPDLAQIKWDNDALNYGADGPQLGAWTELHHFFELL